MRREIEDHTTEVAKLTNLIWDVNESSAASAVLLP